VLFSLKAFSLQTTGLGGFGQCLTVSKLGHLTHFPLTGLCPSGHLLTHHFPFLTKTGKHCTHVSKDLQLEQFGKHFLQVLATWNDP